MSRQGTYEQAVKLDRAAMAIRNEYRKPHPNRPLVRRQIQRAEKALTNLKARRVRG